MDEISATAVQLLNVKFKNQMNSPNAMRQKVDW